MKRQEWILLIILFVFNFIPMVAVILRIIDLFVGSSIIPANPSAVESPVPILAHMIGALIFCTIGSIQFLPTIGRKYRNYHKIAGNVVVNCGFIVAGSGLLITIIFNFEQATPDNILNGFRAMASVMMITFIILSIRSIKLMDIYRHQSYSIYAYAIALGASTQSVMGLSWKVIFGSTPIGLESEIFNSSAWIINLCVARLVIRSTLCKDSTQT